MKSNMVRHSFGAMPTLSRPRSTFKQPFTVKTTYDHGKIIPIKTIEILPGDSFNFKNISIFSRLATPQFPIMDNIRLDLYAFFTPSRILWDNFEKFHGAQDTVGASIAYTIPTVDIKAMNQDSMADYFGLFTSPSSRTNAQNVSALPFRAYNKIYNEWFRPQLIISKLTESTGDGPDTPGDYTIKKAISYSDYFLQNLPSPQRGDAVDMPLGTTAPVYGNANDTYLFNETDATKRVLRTSTTGNVTLNGTPSATDDARFSTDSSEVGLVADLTNATAATINSLRLNFQLQALYEADQMAGTRFTEILQHRWGINNFPDGRAQRPEFLFHQRTMLNVNPVAQTGETGTTPQGNLAGFGTASMSGKGFQASFVEFGYLQFFVVTRADLTYQEGIERMWTQSTRFDFFTPELESIGEQETYTYELFYTDETSGIDGRN